MERLILGVLFLINAASAAVNTNNGEYGWAVLSGMACLFVAAIIASGDV